MRAHHLLFPKYLILSAFIGATIGCSASPRQIRATDQTPNRPSDPNAGARERATEDHATPAADAPRSAAIPEFPCCTNDGWCWLNPLPQGNRLKAIWGDNHAVFAVGDRGTILRHRQQKHHPWAAETSNTTRGLNAVYGHDDLIVAVGDRGTLLRRDPKAGWTEMDSSTENTLYGVWVGDSTAVAVGRNGTAVHYDGRSWRTEATPLNHQSLRSVWGTGPKEIYAVGEAAVIKWDGRRWTPQQLRDSPFTGTLHAIWGRSSNDIYAAGWDRTQGGRVLWHFDGDKWAQQDLGQGQFNSLYGLWGDRQHILTVGSRLAFRYDGKWRRLSLPRNLNLHGVWTDGQRTFAVGDKGMVFEPTGDKLENRTTGTFASLDGIWGANENDVYAVGFDGTILHYDGKAWKPRESGTQEHLRDVWGTGPTHVVAVGSRGMVLRYDGKTWGNLKSPSRENLHGVWTSGPKNIWVVGRKGTLLQFDGSKWNKHVVTDQHLLGVSGSAPNNVWVVGRRGAVLHYDGSRWSQQTVPTKANLNGVWSRNRNEVVAVGDRATLLHYDGRQWSTLQLGDENAPLRAVQGMNNHVYALGGLGLVFRKDGSGGWKKEHSGMAGFFRDVWLSPDGSVYGVGDEGAILRRKR